MFQFPQKIKGWLSLQEGKVLYELAKKNHSAGWVVELGSYYGKSTICLAQGARDARKQKVLAVDRFTGGADIGPETNFYHRFIKNVNEFDLQDWVVAVKGDTAEKARIWRVPIRLLFIDASHDYSSVRRDFKAWQEYLIDGGVIVFHDSVDRPGVHMLVRELILSGRYTNVVTHRDPQSTGLTYFVRSPVRVSIFQRWIFLVRFELISLPKIPGRILQSIKDRGEESISFRVAILMKHFLQKLTTRKER